MLLNLTYSIDYVFMKYWFSMIKYLLCWESGYIHASYTLRPFLPLRCTIAPLWMPEGWLDLLQASLTSSFYEMHLASPTCPPVKQILVAIILKAIISIFWRKNRATDSNLLIDNSSAWPPAVWPFWSFETNFIQSTLLDRKDKRTHLRCMNKGRHPKKIDFFRKKS